MWLKNLNILPGKTLKRFAGNTGGNVAILFGIVIIPVVAFMGAAVDSLRTLDAATLTANALDSAALAAAKGMKEDGLNEDQIKSRARDYFDANAHSLGKYGGQVQGFDVLVNSDNSTVKVTAHVEIPTVFAGIMNIHTMDFSRSSTATYNVRDIELGVMLDVTGSMCSPCSKIDDLQDAAKELVDILIPDNPAGNTVRIGLAPYSAAVNAGAYAAIVSDGESVDGCVYGRTGSAAYTDAAPAPGKFLKAVTGKKPKDIDPTEGTGSYRCPGAEIQPITDDKGLLKDTIDSYTTGGWTAGHLGAAWSWYLVSPEWATVWPGGSKPVAYGTENTIKAVLLMTDGKFNTAYLNDDSADQAENLCDNMKDKDVVVYAVAFKAPSAAEDLLEDCASEESEESTEKLFFDADNGEELRAAFKSIAIHLAKLRLAE